MAFFRGCSISVLLVCLAAQPARAQSDAAAAGALISDLALAVARGDDGTVTARARRIPEPISLDGRLDEAIYQSHRPIDGFIQQEPTEGAPASEKTDVWIFFDDTNIYVGARCWDSAPGRDVVTEMRRDQNNITQNESFTVVFDTFLDRRNGFFFQTTPIGAIRDQAIENDSPNVNWNTVWDARSGRFDGGWTLEMIIPFKSLRYPSAGDQTWGLNFRRVVKWKNEYSYLTAMAASFGTGNAIMKMGSAATLVGIETPSQSKNLELKPYAVSSVTTDNTSAVPFANDLNGNAGFDFKYGITRGLIADATIRTDFAQVEEDVQQVNLTRFSLFFPEKRDFFLEGQGLFAFGGVGSGNGGGGNPGDAPVMFFSRRIGLNAGQEVPVIAGGRVTGRAGRYSIGALNIETGDKPEALAVQTNFTTVRIKRDILRRSNIGFILTNRAPALSGISSNQVAGADANFYLFTNVTANAFYARSNTSGGRGSDESYRGTFEYAGDRYGLQGEHLLVGERFDAQTGYVRRTDFRRSHGEARFSPRPKRRSLVRKYYFTGSLDYVTNASITEVQNKELQGQFQADFQTSDQFTTELTRSYELVPRPFVISPGVVIPGGGYDSGNLRVSYSLGQQRMVSGRIAVGQGTLYDGTRTELSYSGRVAFAPQFAVEPSITLNWVDLPYGTFTAQLINSRFVITPTPRMQVGSLIQFNASTHTMSSSVRLRWEYRPSSELFIVYTDGRNTQDNVATPLLNRSFAVKATRLLRF